MMIGVVSDGESDMKQLLRFKWYLRQYTAKPAVVHAVLDKHRYRVRVLCTIFKLRVRFVTLAIFKMINKLDVPFLVLID